MMKHSKTKDASSNLLLKPLAANGSVSKVETTVVGGQYSPRLWLAIGRAFWKMILFGSFLRLIFVILMFLSPILLQYGIFYLN